MKTRGPEQELTKDFIVQKNNNDNSLSGSIESLLEHRYQLLLYTRIHTRISLSQWGFPPTSIFINHQSQNIVNKSDFGHQSEASMH